MRIRRRHDSNFASVGTGVIAGMNICPGRAAVGRAPDAYVVSGRIDDASMRRIDNNVGCAAR